MWRRVRVGASAWMALVSLGLCGPPALAQPAGSKKQPKQPEQRQVVEAPPAQPAQPAFQLTDEQKLGFEDLVKLAPWLVVIGGIILLAVIFSTIVLGPEVVWGPRKKRLRSLHKKEAREASRRIWSIDPGDLDS